MAVEFNHTIVFTRDQQAGARFLADVLGLPEPTRFGPFDVVTVAHGASLDFMTSDDVTPQHYAFLITEDEFDAVDKRLHDRGITTYADPGHRTVGFNTHDGGRGMYFDSPEGHNLEVITRPYGSGG
ncbi:VOC family protein [Pseudonocardia bannensis]|uniref:VOC family protein n=1 Tax=Pseudonocardia bannensis TaxID=630973 RepID=A0A848DE09_9PSEU|nr:VOC family protein [Pseudonocardia bannensis]NMH90803.1 VOC family protein [Pseudonocardia bannensis]